MSRYLRFLLIAVPLAVAAVGIAVSVARYGPLGRTPGTTDYSDRIGAPAPRIALSTTAGAFDSAAVRAPIVLEIFATWCGHCKTEASQLNDLYARYGNKVKFVSVTGSKYAVDGTSPESWSDVRAFARGLKVRYPVAFDASLGVFKAYNPKLYPTIVLIDSSRKIAFMSGGALTAAELAPRIDSLR
jgi:thiol-disulfide isomerase/thioredoxin